MFEAHQPGLVGETTGAIEAAGGVAFAEGTTDPDRRGTPVPGGRGAQVAGSPTCPPPVPIPWPSAAGARGTTGVVPDGVWAYEPGLVVDPGRSWARVRGNPLLPEVEFVSVSPACRSNFSPTYWCGTE